MENIPLFIENLKEVLMLRRIGRELVGIIGALVAWWSLAVMIGILMYAIFPTTDTSFVAGLELKSQNVPGNFAGFIAALFAFRALTTRRNDGAS
jgi:hypothetical protein